MSIFAKILTSACLLFSLTPAHAAFSPVAVSIFAPIEFPPPDFDVTGLRITALLGHHRTLHGLDFAVIGNITELNFVGLAAAGIFNNTRGTASVVGLQLAGITNINNGPTSVVGLQIAGLVNSNVANSTIVGLEAAIIANLSPFTSIYGAQVGLYNRAQDVYGFQIGIVNYAESLHGIQIGLVNFNHKGLFSVSPILNVGF